MKAFLSPSSKSNSQNLSPGSPSAKYFSSPTLDDSCSSLNYSQMMKSQTQNTKFYSFKKIKQERIKQKNEQGKVVRQMIYSNKQRKRERLKTLDDVKTIISHNSPRSSISVGKPKIEQSIIIMRAKDLDQVNDKDDQYFRTSIQPQTPCFKRRNTFTEDKMKKTDYLKPVVVNPCTLRSIQTGMIFHYQITKMPIESYNTISTIQHSGILQLYSAIPLPSCISHISLILYQPYTQTLCENLLKSQTINLKQIINYMIEIIKILSYLQNLCIYPEIEPTTVLLSHKTIKLKLRLQHFQSQTTQRQTLRQFGYFFSSLVRNLCGGRQGGRQGGRKMSGFGVEKRLEFERLMEEFIRIQDYNFDQAYLKLQAFQI